MGAYDNPKRVSSGPTGAMSMVAVLQQGQQNLAGQLAKDELAKQREQNRQDNILKNMQKVQADADIWGLEQMSNLATAPKTSAIQDELTRTLNGRIDVATQAQIYLKTQFGDQEKRISAQKAITDYYDLLSLTKATTQSFKKTGDYWKKNAATIGKKVTIVGDGGDIDGDGTITDEEKASNLNDNQYFVNALGGIYSDADFEMVYDESKNDINIKVSGFEPTTTTDGVLKKGEYREKYISARAWNAMVNENNNFAFISNVPQLVSESLDKMKPDDGKGGQGLGIVKANGQFADTYFGTEEIFQDTVGLSKGGSRATEEVRSYLDTKKIREDMQSILVSKVAGVNSNVQQAANGWNVDLRKLDDGFGNSYSTMKPTDQQYQDALFDQVLKARTSGLSQDESGRYYKSGGRSVVQPKNTTTKPPGIGYRTEYYLAGLQGGTGVAGSPTSTEIVLENLTKIEGPKGRYMNNVQMFDAWSDLPFLPGVVDSPTNLEHYIDTKSGGKKIEGTALAQKAFDKMAPKQGLYKLVGGKPKYAGDYKLEKAVDRLKFMLDNSSTGERKAVENETVLFRQARRVDWMEANPKRSDESIEAYSLRVSKIK